MTQSGLFIGREGYWINLDFRTGKTHCQNGTAAFLDDTLRYAQMISSIPVLVRLDSGNDSVDNIKVFDKKQVGFIIKRNPRKESLEQWLDIAKETGNKTEPRPGKPYIPVVFLANRQVWIRIFA